MESNSKQFKTLIDAGVLVPVIGAQVETDTKSQISVTGNGIILLTLRSSDVEHHKGQISFPGGMREDHDASLWDTAVREAEEEVGIPRTQVRFVAELPSTETVASPFRIHPFVGEIQGQTVYQPSPEEIEKILEVPLSHLLDPQFRSLESYRVGSMNVKIPAFQFYEHRIWGATARILDSFLNRLIR